MGRQKGPKEDEVAKGISTIRNHPILSKVIIGAICVAAVVAFFVSIGSGIVKWDEVRRVFRHEQKQQPPSAPEPKPLAPEPAPPKQSDAEAPPKGNTKPLQPSALVTSLQVKALRGPGTRVTLSVVMKNESRIRVRVHTVQAALFRGNAAKLETPEGSWDLGAGETLSVGTWIDLTNDAFKALEDQPNLLIYRFVANYLNQGTPTTFTIEGSPDRLSDNLNLTKREWEP